MHLHVILHSACLGHHRPVDCLSTVQQRHGNHVENIGVGFLLLQEYADVFAFVCSKPNLVVKLNNLNTHVHTQQQSIPRLYHQCSMCGIAAVLQHVVAQQSGSGSSSDADDSLDALMPWLCARGPDCQGIVHVRLWVFLYPVDMHHVWPFTYCTPFLTQRVVHDDATADPITLTLAATLLHLRGNAPTTIPLQYTTTGDILCYNGMYTPCVPLPDHTSSIASSSCPRTPAHPHCLHRRMLWWHACPTH